MSEEACCTCASLLSKISPQYDTKTEKPVAQDRRLQCCGRVICGRCIADNSRFATYCPFCQVSTVPSLIPQGLRDPPAYSAPPSPRSSLATLAHPPDSGAPPSYASLLHTVPHFEDSKTASDSSSAIDVLHFLSPDDTLQSLSLAYSTPIPVLRSINNLFADHLLAARRTILIPGQYYKGGVSLSPRPVEGEEEELRRSKVRKWMVGCKVAEYVSPLPNSRCGNSSSPHMPTYYVQQANVQALFPLLDIILLFYTCNKQTMTWRQRSPHTKLMRSGRGSTP